MTMTFMLIRFGVCFAVVFFVVVVAAAVYIVMAVFCLAHWLDGSCWLLWVHTKEKESELHIHSMCRWEEGRCVGGSCVDVSTHFVCCIFHLSCLTSDIIKLNASFVSAVKIYLQLYKQTNAHTHTYIDSSRLARTHSHTFYTYCGVNMVELDGKI